MGFILLMHKQLFMIKFKRAQCGVGKEKRFENKSQTQVHPLLAVWPWISYLSVSSAV